jgi:hypothetical protein
MSRGLGKVQRTVLAILEASEEPIETVTIAAKVYAGANFSIRTTSASPWVVDYTDASFVTPAQVVATLRALRSLERCGKIAKTGRRHELNREHWASKKVADERRARLRALVAA